MRPRDEHKEGLIRQEAVEMIVREGLEGLSMQKLAKAAGVSPATLYIYFKDRDDLIIQLVIEEHTKMSRETLKDFDPDMHFAEGLKVQWNNRVAYYLKHPVGLSFMEHIKHSPYFEKAMQQTGNLFPKVMGEFLSKNIERQELVRVSPEVYWSIAFAPLYQLIKYHISGRGLPPSSTFVLDEEKLQQALELVLKALKP
ncbi:TetR/AcrR family transcriptional regulator [Pedobacter sp. SYSU D00535]|uniref:TetR/AcrR family transcriptional regulator n=1 Tax=Pedobacter sp. SYSU D00535 TaxID=2810308 RepID=UPI001A97B84E|nr:TetR/AcrR family transcriptional regulator [Pedobacter sp. SYSU D00535]